MRGASRLPFFARGPASSLFLKTSYNYFLADVQDISLHPLITETYPTSAFPAKDYSDKITGNFLLNIRLPIIHYKLL
jgi:hypothetical protein